MSRLVLKLAVSSVALAAFNVAAIAAAPPAKHAARAEKALSKKKTMDALAAAEAAVAADARNAEYRMLLGRVYLEAGRFRSAAASFADALSLDPVRGSAALNLALARIGLGDQAGARSVLDTHGERIPTGDRGLAIALAGDPASAVTMLEAEVRGGGSDAKTRQNLALAYALAGRWPEAKLMASYDLDPGTLAQRIMEWSRFTREQQASAQVASLLGVVPGEDPGMPVQLALVPVAQAPVRVAEAAPSMPPPPPVTMGEVAAAAPTASAPVQFAAAAEVVQAYTPTITALRKPAPARPTTAAPNPMQRLRPALFEQPAGGRFVVQVGAFDNAAVAEHGWTRMTQRIPGLRSLTPSIATVKRGGAIFHRLSVSGFGQRSVAVSFCEQLRAKGGQCFVRETAGDAPLQWARRGSGVRLAAR